MNTRATTSPLVFGLALLGAAIPAVNLLAVDPPGPPPPIVHILATDPLASEEGADPAAFTVIRTGPTNAPLDVEYELGGAAENGVDYEMLSGAVTIPAGALTASITVTPIDDFLIEGGESVIVALQQQPAWPPPYIVCWPSVAFARIGDNDSPPTNAPPHVALVNPPDGAIFEAPADILLVARASDPDGIVRTVEFFAGDGSLGVVSNRPMVLPPTRNALQADDPSFAVEPEMYPDLVVDPNVEPIPLGLFRLGWSNVPPGHYVLTAVARDNDGATTRSAPVEITVLEVLPQDVVNVLAPDPIATEPDPFTDFLDTATFVVSRRGPTNFPLTVFYRLGGTASNGVDYAELPNTVVIPEGSRSAEVVVSPLDDDLVEGSECVVFHIVPPVCIAIYPPPPDCYVVGENDRARAVIRDNDSPPNQPPLVRIVRPLDGSVFRAPATISLVAEARDYDGQVVQVEFFAGDRSLGIVTNNPLSLRPDMPPFLLVWSNVPPGGYVLTAEATDNDGAKTLSEPVEITVVPHVEPPVVSIISSDPEAAEVRPPEEPNPAVFQVHRTGGTNTDLVVFYSVGGTATNGKDYPELPGHVVIPAGSREANLVVTPVDDDLVEGMESVVIQLVPSPLLAGGASSTGTNQAGPDAAEFGPMEYYLIGSDDTARAVILDNDEGSNTPPVVNFYEPADGATFPAGADIRLVAYARDAEDGYELHVEFFAGDQSLGVGRFVPSLCPDPYCPFYTITWSNVPPGDYVLTALVTDSQGASTRSEPVHIRVIESSLPPIVTIIASDPFACEGSDSTTGANGDTGIHDPSETGPDCCCGVGRFTVRRSAGTNEPLTVFYRLSGTASNGVDYHLLSGDVTIPRGAWSADIVVAPIDDELMEGTETVVATLVPVACAAIVPPPPGCYLVGDPHEATVFIHDNDWNHAPKVEIAFPHPGELFVAPADIEIGVVARDPDGWVSTVEFYAGTNQIGSQTIYFIIPPPPGEVQKFSMVWSNVPPGDYMLTAKAIDNLGLMTRSDPVPIAVVVHPTLPVVTIEAVDPIATEQSPLVDAIPDTARFVVRREGGDLSQPLTVRYRIGGTASNGVDYVRLPGEVTIPGGSPEEDILVDPIDDELVEGTESVLLTLVSPLCLSNTTVEVDCYLVGRPGSAAAYIRDNDSEPNQPPTVAILSPPNGAVFTAPVDLRLVAAAADPDGWVTTVEFFDGTTSLGIVTNRPWILADPLVRVETPDTGIMPDLSPINPFMLMWSNVPPGGHVLTALATDNEGAMTQSRLVEIKVVEPQDVPIVRIVAVDSIAREGTTNTAAFRVQRAGETNLPLTVSLHIGGTAINGADYETVPETITIPAGRRSARIIITPIDDNLPEHIETVIAHVLPSPVDPPAYQVGRPACAAAVILDNDCREPGNTDLPDGSISLRLPLTSGLPFRVEASTNLRDWEPVMNGVVVDGAIRFIDGETSEYPHRFFRVVPEYEPIDLDD